MPNLALPGNPRYQPKDLIPIFGYDNLARTLVQVEVAVMETLAETGVIPAADIALLTPEVEEKLFAITMSEVDKVEREVTKHDIRALVRLMQEVLPVPLQRWAHVPLTSYDVLDTARTLMFRRAHAEVVQPKVKTVIGSLRTHARRYARMVQIGRTHGQHALPITVGFWLATILSRMLTNARQMDTFAEDLRGKVSGAVGAYNAQVGLGFYNGKGGKTFEEMVLERLGLKPSPISTQILPPEPLAYYLFSCTLMSATLGQYGLDSRHLMRTEIGELTEPFEAGQVGSSTMAHKRNPINFENEEGMWEGSRAEFGKVLSLLVSEHQRDLVGSSVARDLPTIVVKLVYQLDTLLRPGKDEPYSFIERVVPNYDACQRNLAMQDDRILAEPLYLALQMAGYEGDAHALVNERAMKVVDSEATTLVDAVSRIAHVDKEVMSAMKQISPDMWELLQNPSRYVGKAAEKTFEVCNMADDYLR